MKHPLFRLLIVFSFITLSACSSNPKLSNRASADFNLTGNWVLVDEASDTIPMLSSRNRGERKSRGQGDRPKKGDGRSGKRQGKGKPESDAEKSVDSYKNTRSNATLYAKTMRIEQDNTGMGIGFDKRPYMDIDWGEAETQRGIVIAGWNTDGQVEVFRKSDRGQITETFTVDDSGKFLTQQVSMKNDRSDQSYVRVFQLEEPKK